MTSLSGHCDDDSEARTCMEDSKVSERKDETTLQCLEPHALRALHKLVSLVHGSVNFSGQSKPDQSTSMKGMEDNLKGKSKQDITAIFHSKVDPVANILWTLKPLMLRKTFLAMVVCSNSPIKSNISCQTHFLSSSMN